MKTSICIAALLISGAAFVGCDNKDNTTTVTTPDGKTTTVTTPATPAAPDTSKIGSAIDKAVDKGADATKTELNKLGATTAPALPTLGK